MGQLIDSGRPVVRVELAELTFMGSSGLSALLACKRACHEADGSFQVTGAHGLVASVLRITGIDKALARPGEAVEVVGDPPAA